MKVGFAISTYAQPRVAQLAAEYPEENSVLERELKWFLIPASLTTIGVLIYWAYKKVYKT